MQIEALEAELSRLRRQRDRTTQRFQNEQTRARLVRHIENTLSRAQDSPISNDVYLTVHENGATSSDPLSENVLLPRPTRESNLRFELGSISPSQPTTSQQHPPFMPSPPHSLNDTTRSRPVDGPLDSWETTPPLTQDFAPARAARAPTERSDSPAHHGQVLRDIIDRANGLETPPPESWEDSYPTLRRVPRRSPRPLQQSSIDGLGDRHRSPSPVSESHEEETWNNLLATMDHGHDSSSTATSFASVTDLLSTSRASSHRSSLTQNTSTSFGEIGTTGDDTCDLPPGITEEDARLIRERHRRSAQRVIAPRRYIPEIDPTDGPVSEATHGSTDTFMSRSLLQGDSPLSILLQEARESRGLRRRGRDELTIFQAIVERQQSHEHIPDEWWALAGIPPNLAHLARMQNEP